MDVWFGLIAVGLWAAVLGLAQGCAWLERRGARR